MSLQTFVLIAIIIFFLFIVSVGIKIACGIMAVILTISTFGAMLLKFLNS